MVIKMDVSEKTALGKELKEFLWTLGTINWEFLNKEKIKAKANELYGRLY